MLQGYTQLHSFQKNRRNLRVIATGVETISDTSNH